MLPGPNSIDATPLGGTNDTIPSTFSVKPLKVDYLRQLITGWPDGSKAPSSDLIILATHLVTRVLELSGEMEPLLYPSPDGGIDIRWESRKLYCTLEADQVFAMYRIAGEKVEDIVSFNVSLDARDKNRLFQRACVRIAAALKAD